MNPVLIADIKKPATFVTGFVASIELHSNHMWRDLRGFYKWAKTFEKLMKTKKS